MKSRSALTLAALAVFGAAAAASFAGDAKTYKVVMRDRQKAGDVATKTSKDVESQRVVVKGPDGTVIQEKNGGKTTTYKRVEKAIEVDEKGRATKALVYFVSWNVEGDGIKDDSLAGTHVEVTGLGKSRSWKVLTPGKTAEGPAKDYLDRDYGNKKSEDQSVEGVLEPKTEVAIGDSWSPDVGELAKAFGDQFKIDLTKSTAKATLKGVEGTMGDFVFDISFQTLSVGSPAGEMVWKDGGVMTMNMLAKHSLEVGDPTGTGKLTFELKGTSEMQGASITLEITGTQEGGKEKGGEMPPVPGTTESR